MSENVEYQPITQGAQAAMSSWIYSAWRSDMPLKKSSQKASPLQDMTKQAKKPISNIRTGDANTPSKMLPALCMEKTNAKTNTHFFTDARERHPLG